MTPTASVLDTVKSKGTLSCGVIREEEDYSKVVIHGNRALFDLDLCKALGTAVLGQKAKIIFVPYADELAAVQALSTGKVQVVASLSEDFNNATAFHLGFSPVVFFDGQGFMVKKADGLTSAKDLAGKKVCFIDDTTIAANLKLYAVREKVNLLPFPFEEEGEMEAAMYTANCAAMTTDITQIANTRARFGARKNEFDVLPDVISKDPLAVAYRAGDERWAAVVNWTVAALLQAEESGVTAANVEQVRNETTDPAVELYFNKSSSMGASLGLDPDWAVRAVQAVGNYGELYERDLGSGSPLQIRRGLNALWDRGGLLYATPVKR